MLILQFFNVNILPLIAFGGIGAAAIGFAVGATLWRRDWRRGLVACLMTGLWVVAQVSCGVRYPMDAIVGTLLGTGLGWLLGAIAWLDRLLGALVRLARRLMLA